jgi:CRP-like cAMP-binding protein
VTRHRPQTTAGNRLLAALDPGDLAGFQSHLEEVRLEHRQCLYEPGAPPARIYFPQEGLVSLQVAVAGDSSIEAAMVGREGLVGLPLLAGDSQPPGRALVQAPGRAFAISAAALLGALRDSAALQALIASHLNALLAQLFQTAACNAVHSAEQRLARWMLAASDRTGGRPVPLTHECLADMLGVGRPTVSIIAHNLQTGGFIAYRRGLIEVASRAGLEKVACPCYAAVRHAYQRLLPLSYS